MKTRCRPLVTLTLLALSPFARVQAQPPAATAAPTDGTEQVVIERQALDATTPKHYQVPLRLVPSKYLTIIAPRDGVIFNVSVRVGDNTIEQSQLFQMDQREEEILKNRAAAELALAELKVAQAKTKKDADAQALAEAEVKVAQLNLDLADLRLKSTTVRAEFPGKIFRVHAQEKQFVTAKQPILELGDPSTMTVAVPIDRKSAKVGDLIKVKVEEAEVEGKITRIEAALVEFEPLRDIYESLGTAYLEIDNRAGPLLHGQTVYAPLVPREPVAEVPNKAIAAAGEAQRKVQVLRESVVRDVIVSVLAPVGTDRSFITGALLPGDELIVTSSVELADGTQVSRELVGAGDPAAPGNRTTRPGTTAPARPGQGF